MKKITIIGGSGFVGTNLCHYLHLNKVVFEIIDLKIFNKFPQYCKIGDVRILEDLRQAITGDIVIDLAAIHRDDVANRNEYYRTNVEGAKNITKVCNEKKILKIIFFSSVAVYGFALDRTDESGNINPFNDYGISKYEAEEIYRKFYLNINTSLTIIRPTVIFGEGNRGNVYNLFNQIASRRLIMIGSGKNKKSMAYICNVVAFVDECIRDQNKYTVFNYVDTPDLDMNTLIKRVRRILFKKDNVGIRLPYCFGLLIGYTFDLFSKLLRKNLLVSSIRVKKFCCSSEFASSKYQLNNFIPPYSLLEGVEKTLKNEFINPDPNREIFYTE